MAKKATSSDSQIAETARREGRLPTRVILTLDNTPGLDEAEIAALQTLQIPNTDRQVSEQLSVAMFFPVLPPGMSMLLKERGLPPLDLTIYESVIVWGFGSDGALAQYVLTHAEDIIPLDDLRSLAAAYRFKPVTPDSPIVTNYWRTWDEHPEEPNADDATAQTGP